MSVGVGVYYWQSKASLVYNFPMLTSCQSTDPKLGGAGPPFSKVGGVIAPLPPHSYSTAIAFVATTLLHNTFQDYIYV